LINAFNRISAKGKVSLGIEQNEPEHGMVISEEEIKEEIIHSMLDEVQLKESNYHGLLRNLLLKLPYKAVATLEKRNLKFIILEKGDRAITERIKNNARRKESWILLIVDEEMKRHSRPDQESIIAEELAHCFLKHKDVGNERLGNPTRSIFINLVKYGIELSLCWMVVRQIQ
jgi:hypothetical protein